MVVCVLLSGAVSGSTPDAVRVGPLQPEFRLIRIAYNDGALSRGGGFSRGGQSWTTDAPEAEYHLSQGIRRLSRIDTINPETDQIVSPIRPGDPEIFKYPFIYGVEVGRWYLDDAEAANLREYLLRGGFMMVDDFHGDEQWAGFMESFRRIFPDRDVEEIPDDHEVFHVLFNLNQKVQIPGIAAMRINRNNTCEECDRGGAVPHWRGIRDDDGRLLVVINFNMDLGDAWELADDPDYPQPLTALAYRFAISYVLYAMTH